VDGAMLTAWGDGDPIITRAHLIRCLQVVSKGHRANILFTVDPEDTHHQLVEELVTSMGGVVLVPT
jgi:hypothetical protein